MRVLGQAFDPAGQIHRIADGRVVELLLGADESDHRGPRVDPDPDVEVPAGPSQFLLERQQDPLHLERGSNRVFGVPRILERRTPESHDAIADELVQRPSVAPLRPGYRLPPSVHGPGVRSSGD